MNGQLLRNTKITLLLLTLAALFQNCSRPSSSENDNSASLELKARSHLATGIKCPIYLKPSCDSSSQLRLVENEKGCRYHICESNRKLSLCPTQSTPLCKSHEEITEFKDQNSCSYYECNLKNTTSKTAELTAALKVENKLKHKDYKVIKTPDTGTDAQSGTSTNTCPILNGSMNCGSEMTRTLAIDQNSCLIFKCKDKADYTCPVANDKSCRKNETTFSVFDHKGCAQTVCKNTAKVSCPKKINLRCKRDELLNVILDDKGCKKSLCTKKPKIAKQGCSLSKPPRCFSGKKLNVSVLLNGCTKSYCR
jgi:hypothetical protein